MKKFSMTCTCGDKVTVDADTREEAVQKLKDQMTAEATASHFAEKHQGQEVPALEQVHAMIDQTVVEEPAAPSEGPDTTPAA